MIRTNNIEEISFLISKKRVFIFDLDGTIADTELLHWEAYNNLLSEHGVALTTVQVRKYIGYPEDRIYEMIKEDFKIDFDNTEFLSRRIEKYFELVMKENLQPFTYFTELCEKYHKVRFNMLTSQKTEVVEELLRHWGLTQIFDRIISISDGKVQKQEVLKDTKKFFEVEKQATALFEDVDRYLEIARNEGLTAIGIQHAYNVGILENCDAIILV